MKHLILSREYPPAPYPPGGIGTYVRNISGLLAESGETVHVVGQRWHGASRAVEELCGGRLVVHRVASEDIPDPGDASGRARAGREMQGLVDSGFPHQWFSWRAAFLAEKIIEDEGIDVVEAQEWEAPLYYLQLRRALGQGPRRTPPCLVQLHSPTELIFRYNEWDLGRPDYLTLKRLEDYTIRAADALLSPSRFLARQCEGHFGLEAQSISVIPLPIGDTAVLDRTDETWDRGTICYVGRLEPRKGVVEWVRAAVSVALERPDTQFELIGADLPYTDRVSVRQLVEQEIPEALRDNFHFRGEQERPAVAGFLQRARVAVVPSRWENYPNTCMEAMASGLPVLASRRGGMAEMVEDGRTGWLSAASATDDAVEGLAGALRRALDTPPSRRKAMGEEAAAAIRRIGDNAAVVRQHVELRQRVAREPSSHSVHLPAALARSRGRDSGRRASTTETADGMAVVVTGLHEAGPLEATLSSLQGQTRPFSAGALVVPPLANGELRQAVERARTTGWTVVSLRSGGEAVAKNLGISAVREQLRAPLGWVFLRAGDRLHPDGLAAGEATLRRCPDAGIVSHWSERDDAPMLVAPCPTFPYQWLANEVAPTSAIREEALREAGGFREGLEGGYEGWDLANAVMAAGWTAVTYPAALSVQPAGARLPKTATIGMRREILARCPELSAREVGEVVLLLEARIPRTDEPPSPREEDLTPERLLQLSLREKLFWAARAVRHPGRATRWLVWYASRAFRGVAS